MNISQLLRANGVNFLHSASLFPSHVETATRSTYVPREVRTMRYALDDMLDALYNRVIDNTRS